MQQNLEGGLLRQMSVVLQPVVDEYRWRRQRHEVAPEKMTILKRIAQSSATICNATAECISIKRSKEG